MCGMTAMKHVPLTVSLATIPAKGSNFSGNLIIVLVAG